MKRHYAMVRRWCVYQQRTDPTQTRVFGMLVWSNEHEGPARVHMPPSEKPRHSSWASAAYDYSTVCSAHEKHTLL